jgi:DNA-binding IclR family transcriptional regulator
MINSVIKTFQTIECLLKEQDCDLGYLSKALNFPKPTVRRILQTLCHIGYVEQDNETARYRPSLKFFSWGRLVSGRAQLLSVARPFMERLSDLTGETVNLGVLDGIEVICVDKVASKQALREDQSIGSRTLSYCTAFGKIQLAFLPKEETDRLLWDRSLRVCTKKSINKRSNLLKELKKIRDMGYAIDDEEFAEGVRCVGAPIFDHASYIVAGISVAGPAFRMSLDKMSQFITSVKETARRISLSLGWPGKIL